GSWMRRPWRFAAGRRRRRWLEKNPVLWLAGRDLWVTRCAHAVIVVASGLAIFLYLRIESTPSFSNVLSLIHGLLVLVLYLWVAAQASLFFVEARRNGALELVLCTPVTVAQVLRGQWAALQRLFVIPAAIILVMAAAETMLQAQMFAHMNTQTAPFGGGASTNMELYAIISGITGAVEFITCLFALGWFG